MTLEAEGITVTFGDRTVVDDVALRVDRGEVVGLLGPNGSGKSTLLRCCYRVLQPDSGSVRVDGDDITSLSTADLARRVAVVPQEQQLDFDLTVAEVAGLGRLAHHGRLGRSSRDDLLVVAEALAEVELSHLAGRTFPSLSGGEKQRALMARALVQDAPHLILDEPTNHLDIRHQLAVLNLVRGPDHAVVAALHDLNVAHSYCDRVYLLRDGVAVASGPPTEVLTEDVVRHVYGVEATAVAHPHTGTQQLLFRSLPKETTSR